MAQKMNNEQFIVTDVAIKVVEDSIGTWYKI